jgi:hypothetical protein
VGKGLPADMPRSEAVAAEPGWFAAQPTSAAPARPADASAQEWAAAVRLTFATARGLSCLQGIPSHWLEAMREFSLAAAPCAPTSAAPAAGVDWLGLALDLEAQARRVQSQTAERAMLAAAHGLRLMGAATAAAGMPQPVDMVLFCPKCGTQHIDAPESHRVMVEGVHVDDAVLWDNPPHRSHLCHGCGHVWRPADVPTNGVAAVKTKGSNDSPLATPATPASEGMQPVAWADRIAFESAMRAGKGCDVWSTAGDYTQRTGREVIALYTQPAAEVAQDAARLDLLERCGDGGAHIDRFTREGETTYILRDGAWGKSLGRGPTLREAIDDARNQGERHG